MIKNFLSALLVIGGVMPVHAQALTLEEYLGAVASKSGVAQSQRWNEQSFELRAREGDLLTAINFYSSGRITIDQKEAQNPLFEGTKRNYSNYQIGFEQQSIYGLNHKLYYALDQTELFGVDPTFFPQPSVAKSSFNYEFNLPIWRNGFGRSTGYQVSTIQDQNLSESLTARFARKQLKVSAIAAYWRVKVAQELLQLLNEQLASNETFLKWTRARVRDRLGETTDLRQAEAAVALRRYEIESAKNEALQSAQAFNELMQVPVESPLPPLEKLPDLKTVKVSAEIEADFTREDVESLQAMLNAQGAQARMAAENSKPQVDLSAAVSSNGLDSRTLDSLSKSMTANHPSYTIGFKLSVPLDRGSVDDIQKSAQLRMTSLETQLQRKRYEVKAEFEKLQRNYRQATTIFELATAVEKAQLAKYQTESQRRKIGRTTTFQLLSFQQEHQASRQALIRAQGTVLQLASQFLLFNSQSEDYL